MLICSICVFIDRDSLAYYRVYSCEHGVLSALEELNSSTQVRGQLQKVTDMVGSIGCGATGLVIDWVSGTCTTFLVPRVLIHSDVVGVPALRQPDHISSYPYATTLGVLSQDNPTVDV